MISGKGVFCFHLHCATISSIMETARIRSVSERISNPSLRSAALISLRCSGKILYKDLLLSLFTSNASWSPVTI